MCPRAKIRLTINRKTISPQFVLIFTESEPRGETRGNNKPRLQIRKGTLLNIRFDEPCFSSLTEQGSSSLLHPAFLLFRLFKLLARDILVCCSRFVNCDSSAPLIAYAGRVMQTHPAGSMRGETRRFTAVFRSHRSPTHRFKLSQCCRQHQGLPYREATRVLSLPCILLADSPVR